MISDDRLQKALTYLAETDSECAELKAAVERHEYLKKRRRAAVFLSVSGSVEERKARSEVSSEVEDAEQQYTDVLVQFEQMAAKRKTEALIIDVWRSINANRRQGQ
jgi:hypothetical protein